MSNRKNIHVARNLVMVPLGKLKPSPKNVRKTPHTEADIEALAASISALGLLQYPIVEPDLDQHDKPTGSYLVNAGEGRRLAQLLRVVRKEIKKDEPIPCIVDTEHNATEISLAENAIRSSMHPADEFEAFAQLKKDGYTLEDIAARYGVSIDLVKQRLKLSAVSPSLLTLYRQGGINLGQLTAFTVTDDHERQLAVWNALGHNHSRAAILAALTEGQVAIHDRRAIFVGIKAYEAAGGAVIRDLFDEDGSYLTDTALLNRLAREKLQTIADEIAKEGWKWIAVELEFDYSRTNAMASIETVERELTAGELTELGHLQERLEFLTNEAEEDDADGLLKEIDRLEQQIGKLTEESYRPEDIVRAGVFVALGRDGDVRIERGYVRPEDEIPQAAGEGDGISHTEKAAKGGLSAALVAELTAHRTAALSNELAMAPALALVAVTHALAAHVFYRYERLTCLSITLRQTYLAGIAPGIDESVAGRGIAARHEAWVQRLPQGGEGLWAFLTELDTHGLMALLAHCVALSLDIVQRPGAHPDLTHQGDMLATVMELDMSRYWQPTVANYLGRVNKDSILEAVRQGVSGEAAENLAGLKKPAMAEAAADRLAGKNWLPSILKPVAAPAV